MSVNIKFATDNSEYAWIGVTTPVPNTIRDKLPVHLTTDPKWIESHIALVNGMTHMGESTFARIRKSNTSR
jgi:hypothetical protein